jgi:hypothetical protein
MKHITTRPENEGQESVAGNVYPFQSYQSNALVARRKTIREYLCNHVAEHDRDPAISAATVLLHADGTASATAKGIDPDVAAQIADELDNLSTTIRAHAGRPKRVDSLQRGFTRLLPVTSISFLAATYVNTVAWLDVALMLCSQLLIGTLLAKTRLSGKSRTG